MQLVYSRPSDVIVGNMAVSAIRISTRSLAVVTTLVFAPVALGAQSAAPTDADAKEVASYRLTMETYRKVAQVYREAAAEQRKDPQYQELARVEAELETLRKKDEPTEADGERIEQLSTKREELKEKFEKRSSLNDAKTLDEMAAELNKEPRLAAALTRADLSAREFSKFMFAMIGAGFAASMQKAGLIKELPKEVNAENVKFILEHEAELQKLQEEMKEPGKDK